MTQTFEQPEIVAIGGGAIFEHRGWRLEVLDDGRGSYPFGVKVTKPNGDGCYIGAPRFDTALSALSHAVRFIDAGGR